MTSSVHLTSYPSVFGLRSTHRPLVLGLSRPSIIDIVQLSAREDIFPGRGGSTSSRAKRVFDTAWATTKQGGGMTLLTEASFALAKMDHECEIGDVKLF